MQARAPRLSIVGPNLFLCGEGLPVWQPVGAVKNPVEGAADLWRPPPIRVHSWSWERVRRKNPARITLGARTKEKSCPHHRHPPPERKRPSTEGLRITRHETRDTAFPRRSPLPPQHNGRTIRGRHPLPSGSSSVVERQLPKLHVAGSIPVSRSISWGSHLKAASSAWAAGGLLMTDQYLPRHQQNWRVNAAVDWQGIIRESALRISVQMGYRPQTTNLSSLLATRGSGQRVAKMLNSSKTACDFVAGAASAWVAARQNAVSQKTADVAQGRVLGALGNPCPF